MIKFGGHKVAAGLTVEATRIRELRTRVNDFADGYLQPDDLRPRLWIDGTLAFKSIGQQVASELVALAPFGAGNPNPICAVDPGTVPKVMDTITPSGIDQATELDPTKGPVVLHGVPVP